MKKVLKIDSDGYFVEDVLIEDSESIPSDCIETICPQGFIKPKWDNSKWIEGGIISVKVETDEDKKERYNNFTVHYIREKYSSDDEYKILREKINGTDTENFATYNTYIEECKTKAHTEVYGN